MRYFLPVLRALPAVWLVSLLSLTGCDWSKEGPRRVAGGDSIFVNSVGMEFRPIPSGHFMMGSREGQEDERPVRRVEITEPFYLGSSEVTQQQWEKVMPENPSVFEGLYRPVENVTWRQAQSFIDRLNRREGTDLYRLPTEAEWEYATRAGTSTRYYFGDSRDSLDRHAWYNQNSGGRTHRVERRLPNPFGLHDVYGNVWEWVGDAYDSNFYRSGSQTDPMNRGEHHLARVIRGGGWSVIESDLRSANRGWARPGVSSSHLGFRVLREIPEEEQ